MLVLVRAFRTLQASGWTGAGVGHALFANEQWDPGGWSVKETHTKKRNAPTMPRSIFDCGVEASALAVACVWPVVHVLPWQRGLGQVSYTYALHTSGFVC